MDYHRKRQRRRVLLTTTTEIKMYKIIKNDSFKTYRNGNYDVSISLRDGTKIRDNHRDDNLFDAEFPECADICITSYCDIGCPFCYMDCNETGRHVRFHEMVNVLDTFHPWTEVALGGGSPILHPDLETILEFFKKKNVIPSITVHWKHLVDKAFTVEELVNRKLLYGIGVSTPCYDDRIVDIIKKRNMKNAVIHAIAGIMSGDDLRLYLKKGMKVLILGYKDMGRGKISPVESGNIRKKTEDMKSVVSEWVYGENSSGLVSFDNLALKQLDIKNIVSEEMWNRSYMGDDGLDGDLTSASMYIDFVDKFFARNSISSKRHDFGDIKNVDDMFKILKGENHESN